MMTDRSTSGNVANNDGSHLSPREFSAPGINLKNQSRTDGIGRYSSIYPVLSLRYVNVVRASP